MPRRISTAGGLVLIIIAALVALNQTTPFIAQNTQPIPVPPDAVGTPTPDPEGPIATAFPQEVLDYEATVAARLANSEVSDYRIAYLISSTEGEKFTHLSPTNLARQAGALPFSSWDTFVAEAQQNPFDIVLLHESVLDEVDTQWTRAAYRQGVILLGFNLYHPQMAELTGDNCLRDPNPTFNFAERYANFLVYYAYNVRLEDERYRQAVDTAVLEACAKKYDTGGTEAHVLHGTVQVELEDNQVYLDYLLSLMAAEAVNYGKANDPQIEKLRVP